VTPRLAGPLALLLAALGVAQVGQAGWIGAKAWLAAGLIESAWQATLTAFGPAWDSASAVPGGDGLVLFSGHRDTHFRFLADLAPGERLRLVGVDGEREYLVEGAEILDVRTQRLADPGTLDALVLVTCYPFDTLRTGGPLRYVVTAKRVPESPDRRA
jgi:LPXTG-site transpeptidase (sortase) family protein